MISALLVALALGADPPDAPAFEWSAESGCREVIGVDVGDTMPAHILDADGRSRCAYVMVPVDVHGDLLKWRIHAEQMRDLYKIRTTELEITMSQGFAWRDDRILELEKPPKFFARPGTQRVIGIVEAIGAVVLGVIIVRTATDNQQ